MLDNFDRKMLTRIITSTLLSTTVTPILAVEVHNTFYLTDSTGKPITTRQGQCIQTPKTPNQPPKLLQQCGYQAKIGDRDGDGIPDEQDICPDNTPTEISKGVYQTGPRQGCPIDTDNDGVPDYRDDCPHNTPEEISKGVDSRGCPLDTDGDGVPDYQDLCPGTPPGVSIDQHGCALYEKPVDIVLAGDVTFAFNKSELTPQARTTLDELARKIDINLLKSIEIIGHTDSVGSEPYNQALSEQRAISVANYLSVQGIPPSKITQWGEGEIQPIAPNETKIGRAKNRRVEIKITQFKGKE